MSPSRSPWTALRPVATTLSAVALLLAATTPLAACSGGDLPDLSAPAHGADQTTVISARDGSELARVHSTEDRTDVALSAVPENLRQAVVATEDRRFYEHGGVDPVAMVRALFIDLSGGAPQGGSTITQQYVKNAWLTSERTIDRKVDEARIAVQLEQKLSKDEILERYLNTIYFGHGAWGVASAARVYFGKAVGDLTLPESAMIAGVIRSPGRFSPYVDPAAAKARRDTVLGLMLDQGIITQAEHDTAIAAVVKTVGLKKSAAKAPYFVEWVKSQLIEKYGAQRVLRGGLRVRTTLDPKAQDAAERAVVTVLDRKTDPSAARVAIEPETGEVRALVGGRDFQTEQFDTAVQGRRQPGSAFKPFVLAAALEQGVSPRSRFSGSSTTLTLPGGGTWDVAGKDVGRISLMEATAQSINPVFARLILKIGAAPVTEMARRLGITTPVAAVPAIALGGLKTGVSPLEMADAYASLAASGTRAQPTGLLSVKDPSGTELLDAAPKTSRAVSSAVAWLTTDILRGVIEHGTGQAADIGRPAAGKTGTTTNYRDAWFAGYTPDLAAAVWVGYPDGTTAMTDVRGAPVTGGTLPARIWKRFMTVALEGVAETPFVRPDGVVRETYCTTTGLRATSACPNTAAGWFLATPRLAECDVHVVHRVTVPDVTGMTRGAATARLKTAGLRVSVASHAASDTPAGIVFSQDPGAGATVDSGTRVDIVVSIGPGISAPVRPVITVEPSAPTPGEPVSFSTPAADGVTFSWSFGDGDSADGRRVSHAFAAAGTYQVTAVATSVDGRTSSARRTVEVR